MLALSAALWTQHRARPAPQSDQLGVKLTQLARKDDPFNAVFVGSSRVFRGFVPSVFDERMAEGGEVTRTMNLGNPGMRLPEFTLALRQIAAIEDHGLRWIFLDPEEPDSRLINEGNPRAARVIAWHTPRRTVQVSKLVLKNPSLSRSQRIDRVSTQAQSLAYWATGVGSAQPWLEALLGTQPHWTMESLGPLGDGYLPQIGLAPASNVRKTWASRLKNRSKIELRKGRLDPVRTALYAELVEAAGQTGAELVFVTLPGLTPRHDTVRAAIQFKVPLLRFDLPDKKPELYRATDRWDRVHLNHSGARTFTESFAGRFQRFLKAARAQGFGG